AGASLGTFLFAISAGRVRDPKWQSANLHAADLGPAVASPRRAHAPLHTIHKSRSCGTTLDCGDMAPLFLHRRQGESGDEFKRSRGQPGAKQKRRHAAAVQGAHRAALWTDTLDRTGASHFCAGERSHSQNPEGIPAQSPKLSRRIGTTLG